jgi:hypothetical protein
VASWRDAASQQAQDDLDGLLDAALGFAKQQLDGYREFYPCAIVVDTDGQQRVVGADAGKEQPESADLITTLIGALLGQRGQLRGVAIVADVRVPEIGSDAVRVILEHSEQIAITVLLPYRARRFGRGVDYGDLQAGTAAAFIWPDDRPSAANAR